MQRMISALVTFLMLALPVVAPERAAAETRETVDGVWEETPNDGFLGPQRVFLVALDDNRTVVLNEGNQLSTIGIDPPEILDTFGRLDISDIGLCGAGSTAIGDDGLIYIKTVEGRSELMVDDATGDPLPIWPLSIACDLERIIVLDAFTNSAISYDFVRDNRVIERWRTVLGTPSGSGIALDAKGEYTAALVASGKAVSFMDESGRLTA